MEITLEDTTQRGTLDTLLLELGWRIQKKPTPVYELPCILIELLNHPHQRVIAETFLIPVA